MGAPLAVIGAQLAHPPTPAWLAQVREFRMAALLLFGTGHALTRAFRDAIADRTAIATAIAEIDALPAIPRRRLLATLASVLPARCR